MTAALPLHQGLRQLLGMALALATALRLAPRPQPIRPLAPPRYDLSDLKAVEDAIVGDALRGAVRYRRGTDRTGVLLIFHGTTESGDVVAKLGYGGSVGTRVIVRVNGVDLSHEDARRFDAQRVAIAVIEGRDTHVRKLLKAGRSG